MVRGTVIIATEICKGCELCIAACPQDCLGLSNDFNKRGYRPAALIADTCTGCVNCAIVCPDSAIIVYRAPKAVKATPQLATV